MDNDYETIEHKGYTIQTYIEDCTFDPREDDNFGTMACFHNRYSLGDKVEFNSDMFEGWDEMEDYIRKELKAVIILPLYLYDHSGVSIKVGSFVGKAIHAEWDSGQIGFTYATKEDIRKNWIVKNVSKKLLKKAEEVLKGEVEHYDQYIRGNVYGFSIEDTDGNNVGGCGGYIGEDYYDAMVNEAKQEVDAIVEGLKKEVTPKIVLG